MSGGNATTRTIVPPDLPVRPDWRQEAPIEPEREVVDAHHRLWNPPRTSNRYLLPELVSDIAGFGHCITHTVCVQARSIYREDGREELRPVGKVEFASSVAQQTALFTGTACEAHRLPRGAG